MNRNDYQSGWDTDQFPNNVPEVALAYYHILRGGGFTTGGTNFDAKLRRQSLEPDDLLMAHIGGMDICARGLKAAAAMLEQGELGDFVDNRYAGWQHPKAAAMLKGDYSLDDIADYVVAGQVNPEPVSGRRSAGRLQRVVRARSALW